MCGRYGLATPSRVTELPLDAALLAEVAAAHPRWNITPSQSVHAVLADATGVQSARAQWGLVPSWSKDPTIGQRMANARGESVRSKPSFRKPFASRRALVLADLFYEWQVLEGTSRKQPWCLRMLDDGPFALAALWDVWHPPTRNDPLVTCTLITTDANALMQPIHHRMPVIIPRDRYAAWLDVSTELDAVEAMLAPFDANAMRAHMVSTRVNRPGNDDAACAAPSEPGAGD